MNYKNLSKKKSKSILNSVKHFFKKNNKECIKQTTKKYTNRKSPPYPANKCKGKTKKGNDSKLYTSVSNKKGIYRWTPLSANVVRKSLKVCPVGKKLSLKTGRCRKIKCFNGAMVFNPKTGKCVRK